MLHITPQAPPVFLRGAATTPMKEAAKKGLIFLGVAGALAGIVWAASR